MIIILLGLCNSRRQSVILSCTSCAAEKKAGLVCRIARADQWRVFF